MLTAIRKSNCLLKKSNRFPSIVSWRTVPLCSQAKVNNSVADKIIVPYMYVPGTNYFFKALSESIKCVCITLRQIKIANLFLEEGGD